MHPTSSETDLESLDSLPAPTAPAHLEEVLAEIHRIAVHELALDRPISPSHELMRDLGLDSMELIILAVGLENRFRIKLREEDAARVVTVEDLGRLVLRRAAEAEDASP